jgi:hypothetical protein
VVAINFQKQFVPDIRSGRKTQTIRRTARCKTGDELQLCTGQRTTDCELIGTATCAICEPITIADDYLATGYFRLPSGDAHHIARIDGFASIEAMRDWFRGRYGSLPFGGYRIMWNDFRAASTDGRER